MFSGFVWNKDGLTGRAVKPQVLFKHAHVRFWGILEAGEQGRQSPQILATNHYLYTRNEQKPVSQFIAASCVLCRKGPSEQCTAPEKDIIVNYNQSPAEALLKSFDGTGHQYRVVYCAVKHPFFVLVPEVLFDAHAPQQYLPGIDLEGQKIMYDKIARNGIICIYTVEEKWYRDFTHRYPNVILKHYASVLIDYTVRNGFAVQEPVVSIDLEDGLFYLCLANKTELLLCNRFSFKMPEDVLYFLLYSLEQFGIHPAGCHVHISGMVSENAASVVLLNEYFDHVSLEETGVKADKFRNQAAFFHQDACV